MTRKLKFAAATALGIALVGATAVTATAGDNKVHGRYSVTGSSRLAPGGDRNVYAWCRPGDRANLGGFSINDPGLVAQVEWLHNDRGAEGFRAFIYDQLGGPIGAVDTVTVTVLCSSK